MKAYLYLYLLPLIASVVWALRVKISRKRRLDVVAVSLLALLFIFNGTVHAYSFIGQAAYSAPLWQLNLTYFITSLLLPTAYWLLLIQIKRNKMDKTLAWCLLSTLLLFIPNVNVLLNDLNSDNVVGLDVLLYNRFNIISNGRAVVSIHLSSFVELIQCILITVSIIKFAREMKKIQLRFSKFMKIFLVWAYVALLFTAVSFFVPYKYYCTPLGGNLFMLLYAIICSFAFVLLALNKDTNVLETNDEESVPVVLHEYVAFNNTLAARARRLFEVEQIYLEPGLVIEDVVERLGTNRTYFTRMMNVEFGQTFNDYVNSRRVEHSQILLEKTDKTVAEISEESGFGSSSTFCRVFKKYTDTTPETWRQLHRF